MARGRSVAALVSAFALASMTASPHPSLALAMLVVLAVAAVSAAACLTWARVRYDGAPVAVSADLGAPRASARQVDPDAAGRVRARAPGRFEHRTGQPPTWVQRSMWFEHL